MANTAGSTRDRIRETSYELLTRRGLAGLSMRALADSLHIKAASLYKHIRDKDEIIADIQARGISEFGAFIQAAGPTKREKILAYREWALANPHLYEVTLRTPLLRDRLPSGLEEGVAAMIVALTGKSRDHARAVWALVHGLVDLEIANRFPDGADLDAAWEEAIAMVG